MKIYFYIFLFFLAIIIASSVLSFGLIYSLDYVTKLRIQYPYLIYGLPLFGILSYYLYLKFEPKSLGGMQLILNDNPTLNKSEYPRKMHILNYVGTVLSHLGGASVGREGTAVQMTYGLTMPYIVHPFFNIPDKWILILKKTILACAFSAVFGTPIAGFVFAFELGDLKKIYDPKAILILIASFLSDYLVRFLGVHHTLYPKLTLLNVPFSQNKLMLIVGLIVLSAIASRIFCFIRNRLKTVSFKSIRNGYIFIVVGALPTLIYYYFLQNQLILGLGILEIESSFNTIHVWYLSVMKLLISSFTLGCGYFGGEVTPLFFIGSTLGSTLGGFNPAMTPILAGIGFICVFGNATKTPFASALIGGELFGWELFPIFVLSCFISSLLSGKSRLYLPTKLSN